MEQKVRYLFVGWHPVTGNPVYKEMYRMENINSDKPVTRVCSAKFDNSGNFESIVKELKGEDRRKALVVASILKEKKTKGAETIDDLSYAVKKNIETRYLENSKENTTRIANAKYVYTGGKVGKPATKSVRMNLKSRS
ncbi:hypothetical protein UT300012_23750 [Paraclostridium bifermentans]